MKISLVRHLQTEGNKQKRYIGTTDEPLAADASVGIERQVYETPDTLYVSPLLRCRQTAAILYPEKVQLVCEELRECDFGGFENKNYKELSGNPSYQAWIESNGTLPFPNGESREGFQTRTVNAFYSCVREAYEKGSKHIALVVHGGTIMSIMEAVTGRKGSYYEWQVANGNGFEFSIALGKDDTLENVAVAGEQIKKLEGMRNTTCI